MIEIQTEAQRKAMSKAMKLFEGRNFVQLPGNAPRFLSVPSPAQIIAEVVRIYQYQRLDRPEVRLCMEEINRGIAQVLANFKNLRSMGYVENLLGGGTFEGSLEAQHAFFASVLKAGRDQDAYFQGFSAQKSSLKKRPAKATAGRHRDTVKPVLALHCRFALECFGIDPTSGATGNVATLAEAIHFLATGEAGEKASMERAAALVMRPGKLVDHLGMWRLTE